MKVGTTPVLTQSQRDEIWAICMQPTGRKRDAKSRMVALREAAANFGLKIKVKFKGHHDEETILQTNYENCDVVQKWIEENFNVPAPISCGKIFFFSNR